MGGLVFFFGAALIVVNGISSKQFAIMWDIIADPQWLGSSAQYRQAALVLVGEIVFIIVLSMIAENSRDFGKIALTFIAALWLVWAIKNGKSLQAYVNATGVSGST